MRMRINSLRGCDLLLMKGCHPHLPLSVSKAWPRAIAEAWVCTEIQLHPEPPFPLPLVTIAFGEHMHQAGVNAAIL